MTGVHTEIHITRQPAVEWSIANSVCYLLLHNINN